LFDTFNVLLLTAPFSDLCPAGTYHPDNETFCKLCEGNTISTEGASSCTPCAAGTVANKYKIECGNGMCSKKLPLAELVQSLNLIKTLISIFSTNHMGVTQT
jgi:hypothetical protein